MSTCSCRCVQVVQYSYFYIYVFFMFTILFVYTQEGGITYADLDHQKGRPGKFEGGQHAVDYVQVAETQQ